MIADCFAHKLLENFNFVPERESATITNDFIAGDLMEKLRASSISEEEAKRRYHHQCIRSLDWSFNDNVVRDPIWLTMFAGAIEEMENHIQDAFALGVGDPDTMRDRIPLDSIPFKYPKRKQKDIHALPKDDEVRIAFQALFLFLLRPYVPVKYTKLEEFLKQYPNFHERSIVEQERLKNTANWMILSFYTIQPRNNKTFILNLIPRVVEGRNARYITGSGQTRPTADRVDLFRIEGNCEKIKRPPRRKKETALDEEGKPIVNIEPKTNSSSSLSDLAKVIASKSPTSNMTYTPMIIPYYQGFPNFTSSSSSSIADGTSKISDKENSCEEEKQQDGPMTMPFPGGIPIVMIPQMPPVDDENKQGGATPVQLWNGLTPFPYSFQSLPQGVQLATLPNSMQSSEIAQNSSFGMPYALVMPQPSPTNSQMMVNGQPVLFCPQMFMKPTETAISPFISIPVDYSATTTTMKRSSSVDDIVKPPKKRKSSSKLSTSKDSPGLHRSISVGSNEGGLEMLIAAAGDLDVDMM